MRVAFAVRLVKCMQDSLHVAVKQVVDQFINGEGAPLPLGKMNAYPGVL